MLKEMVEKSKLNRVKENLEAHRIPTTIVKDQEGVYVYLREHITKEMVVCRSGSVTLDELGMISTFEEIPILNHNLPNLSQEEKMAIRKKGLLADVYLMSANAVTMDGFIYQVDGMGNRVSAMLFGPEKVFVIIGKNKIVSDVEEARLRVKEIAAPKNCMRLHSETPCVKANKCMDCQSPARICCDEVVVKWQMNPNRIHVIIVEEELGY